MSVIAEDGEAPRRPLSAGLWTLLSWLRAPQRSTSTDSLSSGASDRTAASFAYLTPNLYSSNPNPKTFPTIPSPTDSYNRRIKDKQYYRNTTDIGRKYGILRFEDGAVTLPHPKRRVDRERRATSEYQQRRTAHVPGKRRAPPPPEAHTSSLTLPKRHSRKRPAPQPPIKNNNKENIALTVPIVNKKREMNPNKNSEDKSKKVSSPKFRREKSFLRQIFDNRKRNSAIEPSDRILPNISELDQRAAEIIKIYKSLEENNNMSIIERMKTDNVLSTPTKEGTWICTRCLRKYSSSIDSCNRCSAQTNSGKSRLGNSALTSSASHSSQTDFEASSSKSRMNNSIEDKEKLKEMLREMKNSLPKKVNNNISNNKNVIEDNSSRERTPPGLETPTLRIGATIIKDEELFQDAVPSTSKENPKNKKKVVQTKQDNLDKDFIAANALVITQPVVLEDSTIVKNRSESNETKKSPVRDNIPGPSQISKHSDKDKQAEVTTKNVTYLQNELKVSSLFNPVYIPKPPSPEKYSAPNKSSIKTSVEQNTDLSYFKNKKADDYKIEVKISNENKDLNVSGTNTSAMKPSISSSPSTGIPRIKNSPSPGPSQRKAEATTSSKIITSFDQHSRRRHLINQLEQSIAKGDEKLAAEAAIKLAQLRLNCSILSFSSQIIGEPSRSNALLLNNSNVKRSEESVVKDDSSKVKNVARNEDIVLKKVECRKEKEMLQNSDSASAGPSNSSHVNNNSSHKILINVWIEDKETARGPVHLQIPREAVLRQLRLEAETTLGLASRLQRWIVGRALCNDDNTPLASLAGPDLNAPFYLCLVEPETKNEDATVNTVKPQEDPSSNSEIEIKNDNDKNAKNESNKDKRASTVYTELMQLEQRAFITNAEEFECEVCLEKCAVNGGAVLRECVHSFCRGCLVDVVRHCQEPIVSCPAMGCPGVLQEREIRALVSSEDYEKWLARSLAAAESGTRNAFHCRTRDCTSWALCEPGVRTFPCPVCRVDNCVLCQAIHVGETCDQYRSKLQQAAKISESTVTDEGTRAFLDTLISRGEALQCPECSAVITKKWGCDWVKCSACKTEICWVTRGRRWGPAGRGDTSAGCRCGVDGQRCHPSCGYCH